MTTPAYEPSKYVCDYCRQPIMMGQAMVFSDPETGETFDHWDCSHERRGVETCACGYKKPN